MNIFVDLFFNGLVGAFWEALIINHHKPKNIFFLFLVIFHFWRHPKRNIDSCEFAMSNSGSPLDSHMSKM